MVVVVSGGCVYWNCRAPCYTITEAHSELIESETSQRTDIKDKSEMLLSPHSVPVAGQCADKLKTRKTSSATTPHQTSYKLLDTINDL